MLEKTITFDRFVRILFVISLVGGILLLTNYLSKVLLPFFIAWLFAYLLYPIVKFVQYKMRVRNRAASIVITFLFVTAVIAGIVWLIVPPMIEQFERFGTLATRYIETTANIKNIPEAVSGWVQDNQQKIIQFFKSKDFTDAMKEAMPRVFNMLGQTASVIVSIIASLITLLYMFFILLDYEYLTDNWIKILDRKSVV